MINELRTALQMLRPFGREGAERIARRAWASLSLEDKVVFTLVLRLEEASCARALADAIRKALPPAPRKPRQTRNT